MTSSIRIVGLDCATDDSRIGIALGEYRVGQVEVSRVETCSSLRPVVSVMAEWLEGAEDALLAIDAPLGWPVPLARALTSHIAGDALNAAPNEMFRRDTDRFIQREVGKTPLDVGADRIARTAHAALKILGDLRRTTSQPIPLAWDPTSIRGVSAIEVYPAATLAAYSFRSAGYKRPSQTDERAEILSQLSNVITLPADRSGMVENADALDGVVCLLSAKDFLDGRAMKPANYDLARVEGWIWAARSVRPKKPSAAPHIANAPSPIVTGRFNEPAREEAGVITDVRGLTAADVIRRRVRCPACGTKIFESWPAGWDGHAAANCPGIHGETAEDRKRYFKQRFRHLFR